MIQRVDNWTNQDDKILVDTILDYVRYGRTQLEAFEDAGEIIDRSAAACAYRWNKELRKYYKEELRLARRKRRHQKIDMPKLERDDPEEIIEVKEEFKVNPALSFSDTLRLYADLEEKKEKLKNEITEIEQQISKLGFIQKNKPSAPTLDSDRLKISY